MRILLTGSRGFTGRHFAAAATSAGHEVVPLACDLRDRDAVKEEVARALPQAVVHLGAIAFVGHGDSHALYDVNLFGALNLLDALKPLRGTLRSVLFASSANIYGNAAVSPIPESQCPQPVNHYAMSKLAMEHMVHANADDMPLMLVRPFNYTGPWQAPSFVIPKLVNHFRDRAESVRLGNLNVEREYNDVRMVCAAYLRLLAQGQAGRTYNVCSGRTYDLETVIGKLRTLTGHVPEIIVDPSFVRANEVHRLCGDPTLLEQTVGLLPSYELDETLAWMLNHAET